MVKQKYFLFLIALTFTASLFWVSKAAFAATPVLTSVSPSAASLGDTITLRGTDIPNNAWVRFGFIDNRYYFGQLIQPTRVSSSEITFTIPLDFGSKERLGLSSVIVTDSDGSALSNELTNLVRVARGPTLLNLQGQDVVVSGGELSLGGYNFGVWSLDEQKCLTDREYVVFDGDTARLVSPRVVLGCGIMRIDIPTSLAVGAHNVHVVRKTAAGLLESSTLQFSIISAPTITSIAPDTPSVGDTVIVRGTNFNKYTRVVLGMNNSGFYNARIEPTLLSPTSLSFVVPEKASSNNSFLLGKDLIETNTQTLQLDNSGGPISNAVPFHILPALNNTHLTITEPGGYRTWKIGSTQVFQWKTEKVPATARGSISFASAGYDGVVINKKIADNIPNTGSFTWTSVGKVVDGSSIPASKYPYGFTILMDVPGVGIVSDYKDRTIVLSETTGDTTPVANPTPVVCAAPKVLLNNTCSSPADGSIPVVCAHPKILVNGTCVLQTNTQVPVTPLLPTTPTTPAQSSIAAQIELLRAKIAAMNSGTTVPVSTTNTGTSVTQTCTNLTKNLSYKATDIATGGQVTAFQQFLMSDGYLTTSTFGYFGPATLKATKAFQRTEGINPTGYVGPLTRAKIQALSCQ